MNSNHLVGMNECGSFKMVSQCVQKASAGVIHVAREVMEKRALFVCVVYAYLSNNGQ